MNRIVILLGISMLLSATLIGQSSRGLAGMYIHDDRGFLGVSVTDVTKKLADREGLKTSSGAYVSGVSGDSPAEEAGIRRGDVIVKFGAKEIGDSDDLVSAVRKTDPGEEVSVVVDRGGESKTLTAKIGGRSGSAAPGVFGFTVPPIPHIPTIPPGGRWMAFDRSGEMLGMELQGLGKQLAEYFGVPGNRGVLVTSVTKGGAAGRAGMQAGDVIIRVNGNGVRDVDDILAEIHDADSGKVPIEVVRKGKQTTLSLEVERDDDDSSLIERESGREYRGALRHDMLRGLRERLMELKENLRDNARELRETLLEDLRLL